VSVRTALLRVADRVRALSGPERLDQRPHQLSIVTRSWSGGFKGAGVPTEVPLVLPQHFLIRQVSTREIAGSGGRYEMGDVMIEGITPEYVDPLDGQAKGYSPLVLDPVVTRSGVEIVYRLTGPHAGDYQLVELQSWRPYGYHLVIRRRSDSP
jgi:hypothetical protein